MRSIRLRPFVGFTADIRIAARRLLATPIFTLFAVLSLALGVGVTTAVYSVVAAIFLKDSGIREPGQVAFVVTPFDGRLLKGSISQPDFEDLRAAQRSFSSLTAAAPFSPALTSASTTELTAAEAVDGAYFTTLGATTQMGRPIERADEDGRAQVVVLSHRLWRARFAADPQIVGQTVRIAGHPFEVIGVTRAGFAGASGLVPGTRLWIPLSAQAVLTPPEIAPAPAARDERRLLVFGRLAASVTVSTASSEVAAIAAALDRTYPPLNGPARARATERPWRAKSAKAIAEQDNILRRFGMVLVALVSLVLVVACTNLANLVLARGTARQQDIAVRYALGASRPRLIREQSAESLLVLIAGAAATYLVFVSLRVLLDGELHMTLPMGEQWDLAFRPEIDPAVLGIASAALLISLVVFGLEPAVQLTRSRDIRGELSTAGVPRAGRQRTLLRWQVAVSAGFFIIATMFVQYSVAEARHDSGVSLERLGVAVLDLRTQRWEEARVRRTLDRVVEEAQRAPGVEMVAVSAGMPFGIRNGIRLALSVPGETNTGTRAPHSAAALAATPSIFKTIGVPILQGRSFDDRDHGDAAPVVVLSQFTARTLFGTQHVVGRELLLGGHASASRPARIIGVAGDTDVGQLLRGPRSLVYLPLAQRYDAFLTIVARSTGDPALAVRALRLAIRRADPDLPVQVSGTGRTVLAGPFVFLRAVGFAALALGALTLLLAMAGLFGIQSHIVAHRTREIGVRMSFGATADQIRRMVLKDGCRPVIEGLAIGLFIGLAGRAIVRAYVDIDVAILDPWMLIVPVPLIAAALGACYLPAHRAATVDPNVALRHL